MGLINRIRSPIAKDSAGFSLLEVVVSIAILGTAIALIAQIMSGGLRSAILSRKYTKGIIYAKAKMNEISLADALTVGLESGNYLEDESYRWEREITPYERENEDVTEETPVITYKVKVTIFFPDGGKEKQVELVSLRTSISNEDKTI